MQNHVQAPLGGYIVLSFENNTPHIHTPVSKFYTWQFVILAICESWFLLKSDKTIIVAYVWVGPIRQQIRLRFLLLRPGKERNA